MPAVKERMNLYITKSLMDELRKAVPARERTRFVEEILARELRRRIPGVASFARRALRRGRRAWR